MNYTPTQRLAMAAALRQAKPLLSRGGRGDPCTSYICNALHLLTCADRSHTAGAAMAQELIEWRLGNYGKNPSDRKTFCTWLRDQGVPGDEIWWPGTVDATPKLQAHRLAWMDLLIAELEA